MRVLVVGQGGREHAICWKLRQSPQVNEVYAAPGNGGIASIATCVPIEATDIIELADFAESLRMDLTVVGPEVPLTLGIVDEFQKRGLHIFGPTRLAAEIEASKVFSKEFMKKYAIPTADATICGSLDEAVAAVDARGIPCVIKADGLAGGKGVVLPSSRDEAIATLTEIFESRKFGTAGSRVLVEECLSGEEVSVMALTDGKKVVPFAPAKDYKKAFDGDEGPNTGGMGSHSPAVVLPAEAAAEIMKKIVIPTVQGMADEGRTYSGCLFVGLMLTADGPKVLEYNCRFGDPETQAQILRLEDDLAELLLRVARRNLGETKLTWKKEASACVVVTTKDYPVGGSKGHEIIVDPMDDDSVVVFHAGTAKKDGKLYTTGGRVVNVCARAATLSDALAKIYANIGRVRFQGARYRTDIGYRALGQRAANAAT
ncbi:MAG: phosphoribosylamine--glycine ligase [Acidobacteria bacterium]|nr:phosphoribosylamine--glycine ligase [Acidobacteriota bacterium]